MTVSVYYDFNPDFPMDDSWEPWQDDEPDFDDEYNTGCDFCGNVDVREYPEPFTGKPCCDSCFNVLIGGNEDDPPWRCGNAP